MTVITASGNQLIADLQSGLIRFVTGAARFIEENAAKIPKKRIDWLIRQSSEVVSPVGPAIQDWMGEYAASELQRVRSFCNKNRLGWYTKKAVELAKEQFPTGSRLSLRVEEDPESEEEWLVVDVGVKKDSGNVLEFYNSFTDRWVAAVPAFVISQVHLTFHLI